MIVSARSCTVEITSVMGMSTPNRGGGGFGEDRIELVEAMDSELLELQQPRTRLCEAGRVAEDDEFPSPKCLSHEVSLLAPSLRMSTQRRGVSHMSSSLCVPCDSASSVQRVADFDEVGLREACRE